MRYIKRIRFILIKIYLFIYIHLKSIIRKRPKVPTGNILFIISGGVGDALLDAQAFKLIADKYISERKTVYIVSTSAICSIMKLLPGMEKVCFLPCDGISNHSFDIKKFKPLKETISVLQKVSYDNIILKLNRNNSLARCVAAPLSANYILAALYDSSITRLKKRVTCFSLRHTVDEFISFTDELSQMQRSKEFALKLGIKNDYSIGITYLPRQEGFDKIKGLYITVTIDSSRAEKRWPVENFIALIKMLLQEYEYDVILTGNNVSEEILNQYEESFHYEARVKLMIGKTNLFEWIELIRGARFHIGVDSGSIHVSASVGTPSFCLAGMWDKHRFLPYQVEISTPGTVAPVCIYRKDLDPETLSCSNCKLRNDIGFGNKKCHTQCRLGQPCLCLSKITPDDVMEAIHHAKEIGAIS